METFKGVISVAFSWWTGRARSHQEAPALREAVFPTWWSVSFLFVVTLVPLVSPFSLLGGFSLSFPGAARAKCLLPGRPLFTTAGGASGLRGGPRILGEGPVAGFLSGEFSSNHGTFSPPGHLPRPGCVDALLGSVSVTGCASGCSSSPLPLTGSYSVQEALAISHTLGGLHDTYFSPSGDWEVRQPGWTLFLPVDGHQWPPSCCVCTCKAE